MKIAESQNKIIKHVLFIQDEAKLNKISKLLKEIAPLPKVLKNHDNEEEKDIMEFETFEEWDFYLQSIEYHEPNEFLEEWGMTSIEFRKFIWDAEHSGTMSYEEFIEDMKVWK